MMKNRKKTKWELLDPADPVMHYMFQGRAGIGGWTKEQVKHQIALVRLEIKKQKRPSPLWVSYFKDLQCLHAQLTWINAREKAGLEYR